MSSRVHPAIADLLDDLVALSNLNPDKLSEADISCAIGAMFSTMSVLYLEASTRGNVVHVITSPIGQRPTSGELTAALERLLGRRPGA